MKLRICVPIKYKNLSPLIRDIKIAQKKADLVEIWLDNINNLNEQKLLLIKNCTKIPIIYKCTNLNNIEQTLSIKPEFIDVDIQTPKSIINKIQRISPKTKLILSYHNFSCTPPKKELDKLITTIKSSNPEIIKIATQAKTFSDSTLMLSILSKVSKKQSKHNFVFLCMGKQGRLTRLTGHLFGNYLMYFPLSKKKKTASGQITLNEIWRLKSEL